MAQITINIPDAVLNRVLDAIASEFGWSASSGLTKAQFAKQRIIEWIKDIVKRAESRPVVTSAQATVSSDVETNIVIT